MTRQIETPAGLLTITDMDSPVPGATVRMVGGPAAFALSGKELTKWTKACEKTEAI
jgi:hypothetical protein